MDSCINGSGLVASSLRFPVPSSDETSSDDEAAEPEAPTPADPEEPQAYTLLVTTLSSLAALEATARALRQDLMALGMLLRH
jgi:hypothetical protein